MRDIGHTLLLVIGLFLLFLGLKMATRVLTPYIRPVSRSLADVLETI